MFQRLLFYWVFRNISVSSVLLRFLKCFSFVCFVEFSEMFQRLLFCCVFRNISAASVLLSFPKYFSVVCFVAFSEIFQRRLFCWVFWNVSASSVLLRCPKYFNIVCFIAFSEIFQHRLFFSIFGNVSAEMFLFYCVFRNISASSVLLHFLKYFSVVFFVEFSEMFQRRLFCCVSWNVSVFFNKILFLLLKHQISSFKCFMKCFSYFSLTFSVLVFVFPRKCLLVLWNLLFVM